MLLIIAFQYTREYCLKPLIWNLLCNMHLIILIKKYKNLPKNHKFNMVKIITYLGRLIYFYIYQIHHFYMGSFDLKSYSTTHLSKQSTPEYVKKLIYVW